MARIAAYEVVRRAAVAAIPHGAVKGVATLAESEAAADEREGGVEVAPSAGVAF